LPAVYADLDVVALSSVNEGTPVTLVEAMATGVPIAATAVGGVPDLLQHGKRGELAPPRDARSLADAIERALQPSAQVRAEQLREEVLSEYGEERLCRDLERLYEELLAA
jgi:glycosyltransferase involved in cell wall biosynthesis